MKDCPLQCGVKDIPYENLVETHLPKECPKIIVSCLMKDCDQIFERAEYKSHLQNNCEQAKYTCEDCEYTVKIS